MLDQRDLMQISTPAQPLSSPATDPAALLAVLLAHPEFVQGVQECQEFYFDSFGEAPLTETEMIEKVETNLCRAVTERCKKLYQFNAVESPSYFYNLGHVLGTIAKGLTYAH